MKIFILLTLMSAQSWAINSSGCSNLLNNGWFKKYKWAGVGESNTKAITAETKSSNFISAISKVTTENTTATVDPKYSSNVSTSQTQGTSSWGQCSLFALQERQEQRDLYVAQNLDQIKKDIANGNGHHLETLSWFSMCDESVNTQFNTELQKNIATLLVDNSKDFNAGIDKVIKSNQSLSEKCYILSGN